jgi:hypothetical protein
LVSLSIEGKVNEPFASTVGEWLAGASDGKKHRLDALRSILRLGSSIPDHIRYQLIHRTASAVIEAERFGALHAVMLVHSFSPENLWFDDFAQFCALFGLVAQLDGIASTTLGNGVVLHLGWVHGDGRYLEKPETEEERQSLADEVRRRVGRNLLMFQAAEEALRFVLPYIHPDGSKNGAEAMREYAESRVSDKSLGLLMEQFKQAAAGDKELMAHELKAFVDARNQLVHHFYRNPSFDLTAADGATAALAYLDEQYQRTRDWADIFRAHSAALLLALMETNPQLAAKLAPYRERLLAQAPRSIDAGGEQ